MEVEMREGVDGGRSPSTGIGSRYSDLKKSFRFALRSLLTACSHEDFCKAFPRFTKGEQEYLHRLFIQVITSLHEISEDEFESVCREAKVGATLDYVEQLVEAQELDPLFSDKTNVTDVAQSLSITMKNEMQSLMRKVKMVEENNHAIRIRIELLKKGRQDLSGVSDAIEKLRSRNSDYVTNSSNKAYHLRSDKHHVC